MTPRFISALTVMQLFVIFLGVCVTGGFLRLHGVDVPHPTYPRIMRDYGFWLALLPLAWALASVLSARPVDATPSASSLYGVAGFVLLAGLILVFTMAASVAFHYAFGGDSC
jgi:hypothetical protein